MSDSVESEALFAMVPEWLLYSKASHTAIRVYAVLNRYANDVTGKAHPSHSTIAGHASCSVPTVRRAIEELEVLGAVRVRHRTIPGKREATSNEYLLRVVDRRRGGVTDEQTSADSPAVEPESEGGTSTGDTTSTDATTSLHQRADRPFTDEQTVPSPVINEPEPVEPEPSEPVAPLARKARARDLSFEALCGVCNVDWSELTHKTRGPFIAALADIREAMANWSDGDLADEIRRRAENYRTHFDAALTPTALSKHWALCATPREANAARSGLPGDARRQRAIDRRKRELGEAS